MLHATTRALKYCLALHIRRLLERGIPVAVRWVWALVTSFGSERQSLVGAKDKPGWAFATTASTDIVSHLQDFSTADRMIAVLVITRNRGRKRTNAQLRI
jgi:hypothetical protein